MRWFLPPPIFTAYLPTLLFLNQTQIYLDLINNLDLIPDCYFLNSSGQIHPFFYGAACDLGLKIDIAVIGYTKKLLIGDIRYNHQNPPISEIYYQEKLVGFAVPRPNSKKFFYISVGNNISLFTALSLFQKINLKIISRLKIELNNYIQKYLKK